MASNTRWPGTKRHFHVYEWRKTSSGVGRFTNGIWKCADPACSHFMPAYLVDDLLPGKSSFCTCGEPIYLTVRNMKEAIRDARIDEDTGILTGRPLCDKCAGRTIEYPSPAEWREENEHPDNRLRKFRKHESINIWCDLCQQNHPEGEHVEGTIIP
jgi:hypothetical protein